MWQKCHKMGQNSINVSLNRNVGLNYGCKLRITYIYLWCTFPGIIVFMLLSRTWPLILRPHFFTLLIISYPDRIWHLWEAYWHICSQHPKPISSWIQLLPISIHSFCMYNIWVTGGWRHLRMLRNNFLMVPLIFK